MSLIEKAVNFINLTAIQNSPTTMWVVNDVILPVIIGVVVIIIGWILLDRRQEARQNKREDERIQREKFEQEKAKRLEVK